MYCIFKWGDVEGKTCETIYYVIGKVLETMLSQQNIRLGIRSRVTISPPVVVAVVERSIASSFVMA